MQNKKTEVKQTAAHAVQKNIETILNLEKESRQKLSVVAQVADKVTTFAGSTPFIMLHVLWFLTWVIINNGNLLGIRAFDPYPFSFLTLVVSLEAIFLTLLVLMSQNRMTREADKRAHLDLQIDVLGEQETTLILRMVQKITRHLGLEDETEASLKEFRDLTDVSDLAKKLEDNTGPDQ